MAALTYTVGRLRTKAFRALISEFEMNGQIDEANEVKGFFESRFVIDASIENHVEFIKRLTRNYSARYFSEI